MPRALHVLLLIILMSASNSTIYARDILPSLGVGLGTGVVDKDPGFHFEIKPGVLFIAEVGDFSSICFLPTIGLKPAIKMERQGISSVPALLLCTLTK